MVITTTSVGFILLGLGLGFCGWRFWSAFRREGSSGKTGFLLSLIFFGFAVQNGEMGIGTLFFANNSEALYYVLLLNNFLLFLLNLLSIYTLYYIFFPNVSPQFAMVLATVMGVAALTATVLVHPQPFLTVSNSIDLNLGRPLSVLIFYLLSINIVANAYIFIRLFLSSSVQAIKTLSLILSIFAIAGIINIFVLLFLSPGGVGNRIFDIGIGLIGLGFIIFLGIFPIFKSRILKK